MSGLPPNYTESEKEILNYLDINYEWSMGDYILKLNEYKSYSIEYRPYKLRTPIRYDCYGCNDWVINNENNLRIIYYDIRRKHEVIVNTRIHTLEQFKRIETKLKLNASIKIT